MDSKTKEQISYLQRSIWEVEEARELVKKAGVNFDDHLFVVMLTMLDGAVNELYKD